MRLQRLQSLRWRLMAAMLIVFGLGLGASAIFSYGEAYGTLKDLRKRIRLSWAGSPCSCGGSRRGRRADVSAACCRTVTSLGP